MSVMFSDMNIKVLPIVRTSYFFYNALGSVVRLLYS